MAQFHRFMNMMNIIQGHMTGLLRPMLRKQTSQRCFDVSKTNALFAAVRVKLEKEKGISNARRDHSLLARYSGSGHCG